MEFDLTNKFFEAVRTSKLARIDRHNFLKKVTHNFQEESVNFLLRDLLEYINMCMEEIGIERLNYYEDNIRIDNTDYLPINESFGDPGIEKLLDLKLDLEYIGVMYIFDKEEHSEQEIEECFDLEIDFNDLKGPDRLIYLKEIGFIDYLRNMKNPQFSNRKISALIRPLLGGKITTIQPAVNSLLNGNSDKNNPYYRSKNKIKTIRKELQKLDAISDDEDFLE